MEAESKPNGRGGSGTGQLVVAASADSNSMLEHFVAMFTLGMFCGWYHFTVLFLYPLLAVLIVVYRSYVATATACLIALLVFVPLDHQPQKWFCKSWLFRIWKNYFTFSYDVSAADTSNGKLHMFCDFPHGVFPMGQFLCASIMEDVCMDGNVVCGTGANVVFCFPVMRHIMSWIGTRPASAEGIQSILNDGHNVSIIPGGIAEMYLINDTEEGIYLRKRQKMIRIAIEQGLDIIPSYTFGNTRLFDIVIGKKDDAPGGSLVSKISRRMRMSILLFYGRFFLTVPYKVPLRVVRGRKIPVKKEQNPSDETVQKVLDAVIAEVQHIYRTKKPDWETRPLVVY